jgi:hypothetical protein
VVLMGTPFPSNAVGGTILLTPAIQSPDYVPGATGWAVFQDGTVEFNSGTFRGVVNGGSFHGTNFIINSSGIFIYES